MSHAVVVGSGPNGLAAAVTLAIAGTVMVFGPNIGSLSPAQDSQAGQSLAQPAAPTPTSSSTPAAGQSTAAVEPDPTAPGGEADGAAGEPAPTYPPGQEP